MWSYVGEFQARQQLMRSKHLINCMLLLLTANECLGKVTNLKRDIALIFKFKKIKNFLECIIF